MDVQEDRLESWKEIAAYLKRDIRTAQRWERTEGLPVHRHQHGERGSVYAFRGELDAWRDAREVVREPAAPPRRRKLWPAIAVGVVVAILVALVFVRPRATKPQPSLSWESLDPPRVLAPLTSEGAHIDAIRVGRGNHRVALTPDGAELWIASSEDGVHVIDTRRRVVTHAYRAPGAGVVVISRDGTRVYVSLERGDVLIFEARTKRVGRITTRSHVRGMALSGDGKTLFLAAIYAGLFAADTTTGALRRISALPCPMHLATSPDASRLYVSYECGGPGGRSGHDVIDVVDTKTLASTGVIRGLPNVGGEINLTPDGAQVWIDGKDACLSPYYDHIGCPAVPSGVANVIRTADRTLLRSLAVPVGRSAGSQFAFTPDSTRAMIDGETLVEMYSTATLTTVESAAIDVTGNVVFSADGNTAYIPIGDTIAIVPMPRRHAPPAGMTARWTGDGTPHDAAGLNHAAIEGNVSFAAGRIGQAFVFTPPSTLRISVMNLGIALQPFTIACWIKPRDSSAMSIADRTTWRLSRDANEHLTATFGTTTLTGRTPLLANQWSHVALTWTGTAATLYVNGRIDAHTTLSFADNEKDPLLLGSTFRGLVDEVELYERALAPAEVAARVAP